LHPLLFAFSPSVPCSFQPAVEPVEGEAALIGGDGVPDAGRSLEAESFRRSLPSFRDPTRAPGGLFGRPARASCVAAARGDARPVPVLRWFAPRSSDVWCLQ